MSFTQTISRVQFIFGSRVEIKEDNTRLMNPTKSLSQNGINTLGVPTLVLCSSGSK